MVRIRGASGMLLKVYGEGAGGAGDGGVCDGEPGECKDTLVTPPKR